MRTLIQLAHIEYDKFSWLLFRSVHRYANWCLLLFGVVLLFHGFVGIAEAATDTFLSGTPAGTPVRENVNQFVALMEGPFGALVMSVSGSIALIAGASNAYRASVSMFVIAIGTFVLRFLIAMASGSIDQGTLAAG